MNHTDYIILRLPKRKENPRRQKSDGGFKYATVAFLNGGRTNRLGLDTSREKGFSFFSLAKAGGELDIDYPFVTRIIPEDEGGGYLIEFPDLPGCISDGDTLAEAIDNGFDAVRCFLETALAHGDAIPPPGSSSTLSGKWVQRVPKSLHQRLTERAKLEGVSLNTLVISMLSETLGAREVREAR